MREDALGCRNLHKRLGDGVFNVGGALESGSAEIQEWRGKSHDSYLQCEPVPGLSIPTYQSTLNRTHCAALLAAFKLLNGQTTTNDQRRRRVSLTGRHDHLAVFGSHPEPPRYSGPRETAPG